MPSNVNFKGCYSGKIPNDEIYRKIHERSERERKGNVWAIRGTGEKRVPEATSNFVCTERVSMRHYLETTFLEEADVSKVSLDTKKEKQ